MSFVRRQISRSHCGAPEYHAMEGDANPSRIYRPGIHRAGIHRAGIHSVRIHRARIHRAGIRVRRARACSPLHRSFGVNRLLLTRNGRFSVPNHHSVPGISMPGVWPDPENPSPLHLVLALCSGTEPSKHAIKFIATEEQCGGTTVRTMMSVMIKVLLFQKTGDFF